MRLSPSIDGLPQVATSDERDWASWWKTQGTTPEPVLGTDGLWASWQAPIEDTVWDTCAATSRGENPQRDLDWSKAFGCPTVPLVPGTKRPSIPWSEVDPSDSAGPDDGAGRAALTGYTIDVIDIDGLTGLASFGRFVRPILEANQIPAISIQRSRRGWHIIVPAMGGKNSAGIFPGIDVRAVGGIIVAAPTQHDSGRYFLHYVPGERAISEAEAWSGWWRSEHDFGLGEMLAAYAGKTRSSAQAPAPSTASTPESKPVPVNRCSERGSYRRTGATSERMAMWQEAGAVREVEKVSTAPEGQRNSTLNNSTFTLARMFRVTPEPGIDASAVWEDVRRAALGAGLPGDEVDEVMARAAEDGAARGGGLVPTDLMEHEERFQARRAA